MGKMHIGEGGIGDLHELGEPPHVPGEVRLPGQQSQPPLGKGEPAPPGRSRLRPAHRGEPDDGSHYYDHWLAALERLVTAKQVVSASDLERRKAAWTQAYLLTPHGQPVELFAGLV